MRLDTSSLAKNSSTSCFVTSKSSTKSSLLSSITTVFNSLTKVKRAENEKTNTEILLINAMDNNTTPIFF